MDKRDEAKIMENLDRLVEGISFDDLFNQLRSKGLFNSYMENEILMKRENMTLDMKFLYWYVTTRGPNAFSKLCEALRETNHNDLAELLISHRPSSVHRTGTVRPFLNGNSSDEPSLEEEFPDEEEWTVITGGDIFDYDVNKVYKMRSLPRGLALVINIRSYVNGTMEEREGSEKDVSRLRSILSQLGYEVTVSEEDLTADGILNAVHNFSKDNRHWQYDSTIVVVMTHGKETQDRSKTVYLCGHDAQHINSQDVVELLSARLCEALRGKPKIFFFQACRGRNFNFSVTVGNGNAAEGEGETEVEGQLENGYAADMREEDGVYPDSVQTDGYMMGKTSMVRSDSDIFIGHATSPGMLSLRDTINGSWYIQTLCRVLAKHAWHEDLYSMLQTVRRERNRLGLSDKDYDLEEINQGFNKMLYFQPGIYDASPLKLSNGS